MASGPSGRQVPEIDLTPDRDLATMLFYKNRVRKCAGEARPEPIRQNREALGLRQRELAGMLAVAGATLSGGETGAQILERTLDRSAGTPRLRPGVGA